MRRKRDAGGGGIVYSTEHGRMCPGCGSPLEKCTCQARAALPAAPNGGPAVVRVGKETKGRKGGVVTVVTGVPLAGPELADLGTRLKKRCGSGGTVKDGVIEIQGDHRAAVAEELAGRGWKVQRVGG